MQPTQPPVQQPVQQQQQLNTTTSKVAQIVPDVNYTILPNGEYLINGLVRLDQITDELGIEFPDEDVDTLNGFIIYKLGRLPVVGEKIQFAYEGFLFQPLEISDNIITLVKVTPLTVCVVGYALLSNN